MFLMPSYFYHLIFELCPYPDGDPVRPEREQGNPEIPAPGTDIFRNIRASPRHQSRENSQSTYHKPSESSHPLDHLSRQKTKDTQIQPSTVPKSTLPWRGEATIQEHSSRLHGTSLHSQSRQLPIKQSALKTNDWRYARVSIESIDMITVKTQSEETTKRESASNISDGIGAGPSGLATKGRYIPSEPANSEVGWGIVHLYRDTEETPGLYDDDPTKRRSLVNGNSSYNRKKADTATFKEEECTTLCVLAVPSYLTPSDFLGFVGEKTRDEVTHFRMIRSAKVSRYMVLMKFRSVKKAREWRQEWNGKAFNSMEVASHFFINLYDVQCLY